MAVMVIFLALLTSCASSQLRNDNSAEPKCLKGSTPVEVTTGDQTIVRCQCPHDGPVVDMGKQCPVTKDEGFSSFFSAPSATKLTPDDSDEHTCPAGAIWYPKEDLDPCLCLDGITRTIEDPSAKCLAIVRDAWGAPIGLNVIYPDAYITPNKWVLVDVIGYEYREPPWRIFQLRQPTALSYTGMKDKAAEAKVWFHLREACRFGSEYQMALQKKLGDRAQAPGCSDHLLCTTIDIDSAHDWAEVSLWLFENASSFNFVPTYYFGGYTTFKFPAEVSQWRDLGSPDATAQYLKDHAQAYTDEITRFQGLIHSTLKEFLGDEVAEEFLLAAKARGDESLHTTAMPWIEKLAAYRVAKQATGEKVTYVHPHTGKSRTIAWNFKPGFFSPSELVVPPPISQIDHHEQYYTGPEPPLVPTD